MTAVWLAEVEAAMARGSSAGATMPGTSASMDGISNARAVPVMNTSSRMVSRVSHPEAVPTASMVAPSAPANWQVAR